MSIRRRLRIVRQGFIRPVIFRFTPAGASSFTVEQTVLEWSELDGGQKGAIGDALTLIPDGTSPYVLNLSCEASSSVVASVLGKDIYEVETTPGDSVGDVDVECKVESDFDSTEQGYLNSLGSLV